MLAAVAPRIEQSAAVVVAQPGRHPRPSEQAQGIEHFLQPSIKLRRNRNIINRREHRRVQK